MKKPCIIKRAVAVLVVSQILAAICGIVLSGIPNPCSWWGECWLTGNIMLLLAAIFSGVIVGIAWLVHWLWFCND